ncbi:MAG: AI-2E family transporter [Verrucomicrobiae bacterium]|nr:AI-2E family transporter [Verrucomicrobiae bacterium]
MKSENRIQQIVEIAAVALLVVGCFIVLRPFVSALIWAGILCFSTWPLYLRLETKLKGGRTLAASLMTFLIALVLVVPFAIVGLSLADDVMRLIVSVRQMIAEGAPDPPPWIGRLPVIGAIVDTYWQDLAHNSEHVMEALKQLLTNSREWLLRRGIGFGHGVLQLSVSVFIAFFFYRDGLVVAQRIHDATKRIAGDRTQHFLGVVGGTVKGVVYGILGTAIMQGILLGLAFWVTGIPSPLLLGFLTFFLSFVPMGTLLIWIPASVWLIYTGSPGWGITLIVWCLLIGTVDHFLKPYLISRGSNLSFALVFLGIFGGMIGFGFIGVFIGPTLLAIGYSLVQEWTGNKQASQSSKPDSPKGTVIQKVPASAN